MTDEFMYNVVKTSLCSLLDAAPSLAGRKKEFLRSDCREKIDRSDFCQVKSHFFILFNLISVVVGGGALLDV